DHAIEDFSRAIVQAPKTDAGSYFWRGQLLSGRGDYARAIADFDKVLSILPTGPVAQAAQQQRQSAMAMQAELARMRDGQPQEKPGTPAAPMAAAPPIVGLAPSPTSPSAAAPQPVPAIREAQGLFARRRYADAAARLSSILSANPRDEAALRLRATSYLAL